MAYGPTALSGAPARVREVRDRDAVLVGAPCIMAAMQNDTRTTPVVPIAPATSAKAPAVPLAELGSAARRDENMRLLLGETSEKWNREFRIKLLPEPAVRDLALEQSEQLVESEETIASLRRQVADLSRARMGLETELLAIRRGRGELPRTVGDLEVWRHERGLTQVEAAKVLGVGKSTVERTRNEDHDSPLGPALRRAFERYAGMLSTAEESARARMGLLNVSLPKSVRRGRKPRATPP
jgi:DNA-binding XRE family transcriptional regulator